VRSMLKRKNICLTTAYSDLFDQSEISGWPKCVRWGVSEIEMYNNDQYTKLSDQTV